MTSIPHLPVDSEAGRGFRNETLAQRRARQDPKRAAVSVRAVTSEEAFIAAQLERPRVEDKTPVVGENEGVSSGGVVTHIRPGIVRMYKPTPQGTYDPRFVTVSMIQANLREGWKIACPDCGSSDCAGGNTCTGRPPLAVRICPVCGKRILDNYRFTSQTVADEPGLIRDANYDASTPESRTKAQLDRHLWLKHPTEAQSMGIGSMPAEIKTPLEAAAGATS